VIEPAAEGASRPNALVKPDTAIDKDTTGLLLDNSVFRMPTSPHRSDNVPTLLAGHDLWILGSDTFNLSAVSSFTVTRIAGDHTVFIQEMQVSMPALVLTLCLHLEYFGPNCVMFLCRDFSKSPTAGVTCWREGRGNAILTEPA
jgi:hypothetical protein